MSHFQDHDRVIRGRCGLRSAKPPLGLESIRGQATIELVFHGPIVVAIVEAGNAAEPVEVDVGITRLQRVEGPADQLISQPEGIVPLRLLQRDPDAAAPKLRDHSQLMGT